MAAGTGKPSGVAAATLDQLPAGELARKLAESQQMITRFSRENERLANQNEQLTGSKQIVANDYKGKTLTLTQPFVTVTFFSKLMLRTTAWAIR